MRAKDRARTCILQVKSPNHSGPQPALKPGPQGTTACTIEKPRRYIAAAVCKKPMNTRFYQKLISFAALFLLLILPLSGCADAASSDWVGNKPGALFGRTDMPTAGEETAAGDIYEAPPEAQLPAGTAAPAAETPVAEAEDSEDLEEEEEEEDLEEEEEEDDDENHDVTAGTLEEGEYSMTATIGDGYSVTVSVYATENSIVNASASSAAPISERGSEDLDTIRFSYLTAYYEGDKESAKEDMEDYEGIDPPDGTQYAEIMKYAGDLGKLFSQFGINGFDITRPIENDSDELMYDVYSSSTGYQYYLTVDFTEGLLTDIDLSLEEM